MARYKVGDHVRVRQDIDISGDVFGPNRLWCPSSMAEHKGCILTVTSIEHDGVDDWFKCEENEWIWCEEMVVPAYQKTVSLTDGDIENIKASSDAFFDLLQ